MFVLDPLAGGVFETAGLRALKIQVDRELTDGNYFWTLQ